jgi:hypothetical protein
VHDYQQIPALTERSKLRVANFYVDFDARLAEVPFVAGDSFSTADITTLVTVDFATRAFEMPPSRARCWAGKRGSRRVQTWRRDGIGGTVPRKARGRGGYIRYFENHLVTNQHPGLTDDTRLILAAPDLERRVPHEVSDRGCFPMPIPAPIVAACLINAFRYPGAGRWKRQFRRFSHHRRP